MTPAGAPRTHRTDPPAGDQSDHRRHRPQSPQAALILDAVVARSTETFATHDTLEYRRNLLHRVEVANDPRAGGYLHLLSTVNGWPVPTTLAPVFAWFTTALRAHPAPSAPREHQSHS